MASRAAEQTALFGNELASWWEHWQGMPNYHQPSVEPAKSLEILFQKPADLEKLAKLAGWTISPTMRGTWYPAIDIERTTDIRYGDSGEPNQPQHPIYIISKGRADTRLTARALDGLNVPYRIIIEPQEEDEYAAVIDSSKILILPFSNLGEGSIPARNWVWQHAIESGATWHWILDDNIRSFYRMTNNQKIRVASGTIFRLAEEFAERYTNLGQIGFNYESLVLRRSSYPPYYLNTRVYSCILIRNDLEMRWRGRYNEDTDLSLRVLKSGLSTVLFNTFLADKQRTMKMSGGNTDELYQDDGRLLMAESLVQQHPDVARVTWKWHRWQHHVDYRPFRNQTLQWRDDVPRPDGPDDHGLVLQHRCGDTWTNVDQL